MELAPNAIKIALCLGFGQKLKIYDKSEQNMDEINTYIFLGVSKYQHFAKIMINVILDQKLY